MKNIDWEDFDWEEEFDTIRIVGKDISIDVPVEDRSSISVVELYSYMKDKWKSDDNLMKYKFPLVAITSNHIKMINDYKIDERSFDLLTHGIIEQGDSIYTTFISLDEPYKLEKLEKVRERDFANYHTRRH